MSSLAGCQAVGSRQAGPCRQLEHKRLPWPRLPLSLFYNIFRCLFTYISEWHYNANNGAGIVRFLRCILQSYCPREGTRARGESFIIFFFFVFLYPRRIFCGGQYDAWWDAMTGPQDNGQRTSNDGRLETHNKAQKGAKQFALCHRSDRKPDRPEMKLIRIN